MRQTGAELSGACRGQPKTRCAALRGGAPFAERMTIDQGASLGLGVQRDVPGSPGLQQQQQQQQQQQRQQQQQQQQQQVSRMRATTRDRRRSKNIQEAAPRRISSPSLRELPC
ncbi:uncharacterized protein M421DRAFT_264620 [Didymella exigua CBS 183.55]|uniref:Uncharacterized protein n=1 Tax=Didymella exigua CBS 183.55 TaxID=1150837 RepID=A0A6A5RHK5_9PLEO|nr:uncharacterized protein M421DRAFT_264620 [Didymella exigua CBS 183.55]KAF1925087.1 hypothetical protein M421DRAFT_264620 [Didymella exigua CBS 183.55]